MTYTGHFVMIVMAGVPGTYTGHFVMIVMAGDACDLYGSLRHDCDGWGCL